MANPVLELRGVQKRFGGLVANQAISFSVDKGEVLSVIGPNGAGKTTLFNLITGVWKPTEGEIHFKGQPLHRMAPEKIARLGVGRTFQTPQVFGELSMVENVMIGWDRGRRPALLNCLAASPTVRRWDRDSYGRAMEKLALVGLDRLEKMKASNLSFGQQRLMEVARALTLEPDLLLLDEPAAGLTRGEVKALLDIMNVLRSRGVSIIFIEHDVATVMEVADKIVVLNFGEKIAEGKPEAIRSNLKVREAYLGSGQFKIRKSGSSVGLNDRSPMLKVERLGVFRGSVRAIKDVSFEVKQGEVVAILGANGAGKTTLLGTIAGFFQPVGGRIEYQGRNLGRMQAEEAVFQGIALVPEGRQVFGPLTVAENLRLGSFKALGPLGRRSRSEVEENLRRVYDLFPRLAERAAVPAGNLSGGEQQMLAIARALMSSPRLLLLDEPLTGIAPKLVEQILVALHSLRERGTTIILVEQNAQAALAVVDRAYVLERGSVKLEGTADQIAGSEDLRTAYLG